MFQLWPYDFRETHDSPEANITYGNSDCAVEQYSMYDLVNSEARFLLHWHKSNQECAQCHWSLCLTTCKQQSVFFAFCLILGFGPFSGILRLLKVIWDEKQAGMSHLLRGFLKIYRPVEKFLFHSAIRENNSTVDHLQLHAWCSRCWEVRVKINPHLYWNLHKTRWLIPP